MVNPFSRYKETGGTDMAERTKAEENFIDQYTRKLLVDWAYTQTVRPMDEDPLKSMHLHGRPVFLEHALARGWLTKRTPHRLTAKGFSVATSFLKR
tara:strand:+ start:4023 stop:4310 length:288 start_codon:yes stop_codon:yes gene_type:complete